jgi:RNA polymerase sigma-70 factor (sigma-E family)
MMPTMALEDRTAATAADVRLASLHREHYRDLVRLAGLLLHDRGASEEVVQDAFVRLHVSWRSVRDPDRAAAWLRSSVLNGARSRLRHAGVRRRHQPVGRRSQESAEDTAMAGEARDRVVVALQALPVRQREAVVLRYYLDLSEAQMAEAMGISTGSVKTHLHRGLAALHTQLGERP